MKRGKILLPIQGNFRTLIGRWICIKETYKIRTRGFKSKENQNIKP